MQKFLLIILSLLIPATFYAQGSMLPLNNPGYHIIDRLEIKTGLKAPFHTSVKGITRGAVIQYALALDTLSSLSAKDKADLKYLFIDNNEWLDMANYPLTIAERRATGYSQMEASMKHPTFIHSKKPLAKYFYQTPANLFDINDRDFHIRVNPLLHFSVNQQKNAPDWVFMNTRGVQVRGGVDDRIYFFMNIKENQARFPQYIDDWITTHRAIPHQALFKNYKSHVFNVQKGYDFLNGQGYVGFNITRHVGLQFGYGRQFIGNGYRSLLLSDFANNYPYLKLNWKVWKFHFQNLFAELNATANEGSGDQLEARKYMAAHYLGFKLRPNLALGIFEVVIFSRNDHFEFQYLNPVIFYRLAEHALGSPDNVLIGLNGKWNFLRHFQLYGQLMLDEFKFDELFIKRNGWWGNKFGFQGGLKYINAFGVDHLDLQFEGNYIRPYTYTHGDSSSVYNHFHQPLAHPNGANVKEAIFKFRYQPHYRITLEGRLLRSITGTDTLNSNWGNSLLLPNTTREQEYGNFVGQGVQANTTLVGIDFSYMFRHNLFLDLHYFYRKRDSAVDQFQQFDQYMGAGVRMNIFPKKLDF